MDELTFPLEQRERLAFTLVVTGKGCARGAMPLSFEQLATLVRDLPDTPAFAELYGLAAGHPATAVREQVAAKENLPADAVAALARDPAIPVLATIVGHPVFAAQATLESLRALIATDPRVAIAIATVYGLVGFPRADKAALARALAEHPDPGVARALVEMARERIPVRVVRMLLKHPEPSVVRAARSMLDDHRRREVG